jgi:hypothetical protein
MFEHPHRLPGWIRLLRKRSHTTTSLTTGDFDALVGHAAALIDAPASVFAHELMTLYPEAKIILNVRRNWREPHGLDGWQVSVEKTIIASYNDKVVYAMSWFSGYMFWCWHVYFRWMWADFFRTTVLQRGRVDEAIRCSGKRVYREHCYSVLGREDAKGRLLEWSVEDGWGPLCKVSTHVQCAGLSLLCLLTRGVVLRKTNSGRGVPESQ